MRMSVRPVVTNDAVVLETPARLATSIRVTRWGDASCTGNSLRHGVTPFSDNQPTPDDHGWNGPRPEHHRLPTSHRCRAVPGRKSNVRPTKNPAQHSRTRG